MWEHAKSTAKAIPGLRALVWKVRNAVRQPSPRLLLLQSFPKHAVGAEIGVHEGDFSQRILAVAKPTTLFLVDPWQYESGDDYDSALYGGEKGKSQRHMDERYGAVLKRFAPDISAGRVRVIRSYSEQALEAMQDESLDFIYIDGNHTYDYVKTDLDLSFRKVRDGGIVAGDDYRSGGWWGDGVKRAVDEFAASKGVPVQIIGDQFMIRKETLRR